MTNLETLKQQTADMEAKLNEMKAEIKRIENGWEMKCPYKYGDEYFFIDEVGSLIESRWDGLDMDKDRFSQGNIFPTKQATELEAKRRNLLTRFRAFRDECNDGWKPDWNDMYEAKWSAVLSEGELLALSMYANNSFDTFGHFKNQEDCQRAIELFGEEIIELFVEA
nr:MAG TPA: protein of unknown function (DUF5320) [Caudoviricetes sp.]